MQGTPRTNVEKQRTILHSIRKTAEDAGTEVTDTTLQVVAGLHPAINLNIVRKVWEDRATIDKATLV